MSGAAHYERTVRLPSLERDLAFLAAIEQVVLDASAAIPWRELRSLERSVEVRGPNGSVSVTSVDDASKQLARSGLTVDSVQLLIREPLSAAPRVRAVRVDANRGRAGTAHVWGPQLTEVIGLAQEIANVSGGNLVNGDRRTTESRPIRAWWREQRISGQVIAGTIAGLIVLTVAIALSL